jgi:hypothetical protein
LLLEALLVPALELPLVFVAVRLAEGCLAARTNAWTSSSLRMDRQPANPWRFANSASSFQL